MPQIREYASQVNQATTTGTRRATAEDFGAGTARALGEAGTQLSGMGQAMDLAKQANNLATLDRVKAEHNASLLETKHNLKNDPEYIDNPAKFDDVSLKLQEDAQERLGEIGMYDKYVTDMTAPFTSTSIGVQQDTIKRVSQNGKAAMDLALGTYTSLAATATSSVQQDNFILQGLESIQSKFDSNVLNPAEFAKANSDFLKNTRTAIVGNMIEEDPHTAALMATKRVGVFADMPEQERQGYVTSANKAYQQQLTFEQGQEDRERRENERAETQLQETTVRQLEEMKANDELTPTEVLARKNFMTPEAFRFYMGEVNDPKTVETVYSDLILRAMGKENVKAEATRAYHAGDLEQGAYDRVISTYEASTNSGSGKLPPNFSDAVDYINTTTKPNETNPRPGSAMRKGNAMLMFTEWAREHPKASFIEANDMAQEMVARFDLVDRQAFRITNPVPRHMVGDRDIMDIPATVEALQEARKTKQISKREYLDELRTIKRWKDFQAADAAKDKGTK